MAVENEKNDFDAGWDETEEETPTGETPAEKAGDEGEEVEVEEEQESEVKPEEKAEEEEPAPTNEGKEQKPWFESDPDLKPEHRQKIKSFNGMYLSEKKKREALEAELANLRKAPAEPVEKEPLSTYNFDEAEDRYAEALIDGDKEGARAIRREIDSEKDKIRDTRAIREVVAEAAENYPFLDNKSDQANPEAIEKVIAARIEFEKKGYGFATALKKAVMKVAPEYESIEEAETDSSGKPAGGQKKDKLKRMAVVKTKHSPVSGGGGRRADKNDFEGSWDEA